MHSMSYLTHAVAHKAHDCLAHSAEHTAKDGVLKYALTTPQGTWPPPQSPATYPKMQPQQSYQPPPPEERLAGEQACYLQTTSTPPATSWQIAWPAKQPVRPLATHLGECCHLVAAQARCGGIAAGCSAAAPLVWPA